MADKILVIDDEQDLRDFVSMGLELNDYEVDCAENGEEGLEKLKDSDFDCIISDIEMPKLSGLDFLKKVKEYNNMIPVIMLTGVKNLNTAIEVMRLGAQDYLMKPINIDELTMAVAKSVEYKKLLELNLKLQKENENYQKHLEKMVKKRTNQLEVAIFDSLSILAQAIEAKDVYTRGHSNRVRLISIEIAKHLNLTDKQMTILHYGAMLHDVGKIGVKDKVLLKNGALTDEEFFEIKSHPSIGAGIIQDMEYYKPMMDCILYHHEKYNGTGYPDGLKGEEIPLLARIIGVADTYDAMTTTRPYRTAMPKEKAISIIKEVAGSQLDPEIVDIFLKNKIYQVDFEEIGKEKINKDRINLNNIIADEEDYIVKPAAS